VLPHKGHTGARQSPARDPHHPKPGRFAPLPDPPPEDASSQVKMASTFRTVLGKAMDSARTCTGEPVPGIITEVLGFRQFSLRGVQAIAGAWCLACVAFHLTRFRPREVREPPSRSRDDPLHPSRWNTRSSHCLCQEGHIPWESGRVHCCVVLSDKLLVHAIG
jgi:hypothetical protein